MGERLPVTALVSASLFFTGVTYASTLPYSAIVAIEALGISNAAYALLMIIGALVSALASVSLGYLSDKVRDRRLLVIGCALMGALAYGLIYFLRTQVAYVIAYCVIMPFGGALFSQTFSFARTYYNRDRPDRAEFMISILRTVFAIAWVVVPPVAGYVASVSSVFNVYAVAASAYLVCAAIFVVMLADPRARIGAEPAGDNLGAPGPKIGVETPILFGIGGITLISVAIALHVTTTPLAIVNNFGGTIADVGIYAGLAALLEIPFMLLWGLAVRRVSKGTIIAFNAVLYAVYLFLLSRAASVSEVLWLQGLNAIATAALLSITISYMQEAIRGRVGLSTSLLDVVRVISILSAAGLFALLTEGADYLAVFVAGSVLSAAGAVVLFLADSPWRRRVVAASG